MKNSTLKKTFIAGSCLIAAGYASFSFAAPKDYTASLQAKPPAPATSATATDLWRVTCPAKTTRLSLQIRNNTVGRPYLSAQVQVGFKARNTTDLTAGTTTAAAALFSPIVYLVPTGTAGKGPYFIQVNRGVAYSAVQAYTLRYECLTATGSPVLATPAVPTKLQDN